MTALYLNGQRIPFQPTQFVRAVNDRPRVLEVRAANCDRGGFSSPPAPVASGFAPFHTPSIPATGGIASTPVACSLIGAPAGASVNERPFMVSLELTV
jgi:hypothetical protein